MTFFLFSWNRLQRDKVPPRSPATDYRRARLAKAEARARAQELLARRDTRPFVAGLDTKPKGRG
jgi:hypothetical protein